MGWPADKVESASRFPRVPWGQVVHRNALPFSLGTCYLFVVARRSQPGGGKSLGALNPSMAMARNAGIQSPAD